MLPSIFGENLFDDFFDSPFERSLFGRHNPLYGKHAKDLMKTDVRETDNTYELDVDLPGFSKEDIHAKVENGYLTISASKGLDKDKKDKDGHYIRRERYSGQCMRSFYVGEKVKQEDVGAKFENGILRLSIPKQDMPQIGGSGYIAIE